MMNQRPARITTLMETTLKYAFSILALALVFPAIGEAQSETLTTGTRIRVTSPSDDLKGHVTTVTDVRGDSIVVAGRAGSRTIALTDVTALDVSAGRRMQILPDALIGFGLGAITGFVIGASTYEEGSFFSNSPAAEGAFAGALMGAMGLVTGGVVGIFHRKDRWTRAEPRARVTVGAARSVGVTFNFSRAF